MHAPHSRDQLLHVQTDFGVDELSARRTAVMAAMGGGCAVLAAIPGVSGSHPYRQTNEFYYLTGLDVAGAYLVLDADAGRSALYLRPRDARGEQVEGPMLCDEDGEFVRKHTGVEQVLPLAQLRADLAGRRRLFILRDAGERFAEYQDTLRAYAREINADPLNQRPTDEEQLLLRLAQLCPCAEFRDLSAILHELRLIKSPAELRLMRRAGQITARATLEAMRATRAGSLESDLAAVADYVFRANGALGGAYRPIISTGRNIWAMHYWRLNTRLPSGDWVLFDYAPDFRYYTSDIGRMWPVDGVYSDKQRSLYQLVIDYHKLLISLIKPGVTVGQIYSEAAETFRPTVESWRFPHEDYRAAGRDLLASTRPLSHPVGMAVHDPGNYTGRPLKAGDVFSVDPELFIRRRREYVRCEDTVAVTEDGCEVLTGECPLEIDDVERVMREPGLLQTFPAKVEG